MVESIRTFYVLIERVSKRVLVVGEYVWLGRVSRGNEVAVAKLFPVSDELAQDFEEIRRRLFEEFHASSPFAFFSNLDTLDISAAYDDDVPALIGINDALIFIAWIN